MNWNRCSGCRCRRSRNLSHWSRRGDNLRCDCHRLLNRGRVRNWHSRDCGSDDRLGRRRLNNLCRHGNRIGRSQLLSNWLLHDRLWNRHGHRDGGRGHAVRNRHCSV